MQKLLQKVAKKITPKNVSDEPQELLQKINILLEPLDAKAVLGGSWAKGTYLPKDHDIDVFVKFSEEKNMNELLSVLQKFLKVRKIHGSRDYFEVKHKSYTYEIVPVLNIKKVKEAKNTTDLSPLHVNYVVKAIKKNPKLQIQIRLAKQFCKSAKVYGAESYIKGFSGHVIDLLVIYYGSFIDFVKAAASWQQPVFIDTLKKYASANHLNSAKLGPLILIDPIQRQRNAAAALSIGQLTKLKKHSQKFLANPKEKFFKVTKLTPKSINKIKSTKPRCIYELTAVGASNDVAGTKLLKAYEFILREALKNGFLIKESGFEFSNHRALCYIIVDKTPIKKNYWSRGPSLRQKEHVKKFKDKHKTIKIENDTLYAQIKRPHINLTPLIKELFKSSYVTNRSTNSKII